MPAAQPSMAQLKRIADKQKKQRAGKPEPEVTPGAVAKIDRGNPKWYSPEGTDIRVPLPDGRVCVIGEIPREIPRAFYKAAIKAGCLADTQIKPADMKLPTSGPQDDPEQRAKIVHAKILEAATAEDPEDPKYADAFVEASGLPDIRWLSRECGFPVQKSERDAAWNQIQIEIGEIEDDEAEGGQGGSRAESDSDQL